jgi:hypothetical protein
MLACRRVVVAALYVGRLAERDDRHAVTVGALAVDAAVVVALVERARLGDEPALATVWSREATKVDSCSRAVATVHATGRSVAVQTDAWMR